VREHHFDDLALLRRHQFTDVIRLNRQLAMLIAAVDQNCELHAARAAEIDQLIQRGAHSAPSVKHIIDQDDRAVFDVAGQFGSANARLCSHRRKIVAIKGDVEDYYRRTRAFQISNLVGDAIRERHTAAAYPHHDQIMYAVSFCDDFRSQTGQRAVDARVVHDAGLFSEFHWRKILTTTVASDK